MYAVPFFWCLFLCTIDAYLVFAYKTDLTETFRRKWPISLAATLPLYTISVSHGWSGS